jgi:hypothetical protein
MGQQLQKPDTSNIVSYLLPREAARMIEIPLFDRFIGARDVTIRTSELTSNFMIMLAREHAYITKLTLEIDDDGRNIDQTRDYHLDLPNLTHLVLRSTRPPDASATHPPPGCKPLNDWAPFLETLDIDDLTTLADVQLVWTLFPNLQHLKHFWLTWMVLYLYHDNQDDLEHIFPQKLEYLHITMRHNMEFSFSETSVYCMQWIKLCAKIHRPCALFCVVPKWTRRLGHSFVNMHDDGMSFLPPNTAFSHFHLEVHELDGDLPMPPFRLLDHFVNEYSSVYLDIKASGIENNRNIRWIKSILEGLDKCENMKTNIRLQCSLWSDDMNATLGEIAVSVLYLAGSMHDHLFPKTIHFAVSILGGITPDIHRRWTSLLLQDNLSNDNMIRWNHMLKHKAMTFQLTSPKQHTVKLNLPVGFKRKRELSSEED